MFVSHEFAPETLHAGDPAVVVLGLPAHVGQHRRVRQDQEALRGQALDVQRADGVDVDFVVNSSIIDSVFVNQKTNNLLKLLGLEPLNTYNVKIAN